jgi:hypothetical protein
MRLPFAALLLVIPACQPSSFDKLEREGEHAMDAGGARRPASGPGIDAVMTAADASACVQGSESTCGGPAPTPSCLGAQCTDGCEPSHADCDGDRDRGASGTGCETRLSDNDQHCGECGLPCTAPSNGYARCRASRCISVSLLREPPTALAPHGGGGAGGGGTFDQICPDGEVVTGVDGKISEDVVVDSMRVRCARLTVARGDDELPTIVLGDNYFPNPMLGGHPQLDEEGTLRKPYALHCGPGEFVTEVQIAVWGALRVGDLEVRTIKDLALRCAKARVTPSLQVVIEPSGPVLETGIDRNARVASTPSWTTDRCAGSALAGFTGRHGLHVDQLIGQCSALKLTVNTPAR